MRVSASRKVPDGKMVNVSAEITDGKVKEAEIRGDFFLQPPGKLDELEKRLEGADVDEEVEKIRRRLDPVDTELIGFSREDVAKALKKACRGEKE